MSARSRPYKLGGLEATFTGIRVRERGRDPLTSFFSPADRTGKSFLKRDFRWWLQARERDSFRSCTTPPMRCEPICWPRPRPPHFGACAPVVVPTNSGSLEPACLGVAVRFVPPERTIFVSICYPVY